MRSATFGRLSPRPLFSLALARGGSTRPAPAPRNRAAAAGVADALPYRSFRDDADLA